MSENEQQPYKCRLTVALAQENRRAIRMRLMKPILLAMLCVGTITGFSSCRQQGKTEAATSSDSIQMLANSHTVLHEGGVHLQPNQAINEATRFVAGLPVENKNSKLYALTQTKEWKNHARNMDQIWNSYQQTAPKIVTFANNELSPLNTSCRTLFYPFGGPDFLFAGSLFPEMDTYFLIGLERTGHAIQVKHPSAKTYKLYQDAVSDVLSLSFFRTKDMNTELENDTIDGVVPVISMLMARMNKQIIDIKNKVINDEGEIVDGEECRPDEETHHSGLVEVSFCEPGKQKLQKLYYYATDLSNEGLAKNRPLMTYLHKMDSLQTVTFIKSASYLMHESNFSTIREMILKNSKAVVQDDSGIPFTYYSPVRWDIALYGTFYKPITTYAQYTQPALRNAYQLGTPGALNFRIGFARQSNLQIMRKKALHLSNGKACLQQMVPEFRIRL